MHATFAHALRMLINPLRRMRPTAADRARHTGDEPLPAAGRAPTAAEWFAQLEEHFPRAYLHALASDLDQLRAVGGCTPADAAEYARREWCGPSL